MPSRRIRPDNWNAKAEEGFALAVAPLMREIADGVRAKLPDGTHFALQILAPSSVPGEAGRLMAISSDRDVMAPHVAQWVTTILRQIAGRR